jgi:hypothetical protein
MNRWTFRVWLFVFVLAGFGLSGKPASAQAQAAAAKSCNFRSADGRIKHVIQIIFDNVHLHRDNPNVPSDMEQMPHLLNFIRSKGTLDTNHHAVLISHTADDELTYLTGVYGDRHGIPVANSFGVFRPDGSVASEFSFFYWTNHISDLDPSSLDTTYGMLSGDGKNAPAPWVPFTRAGCDVGVLSSANIAIETPSFDVPFIFGPNSPEAKETPDQQFNDFEGAAVHCAKGSPVCSSANHGVADVLPQEPGGYTGFNALYGPKYMNQVLGPILDLDGNPMPSFPGFSPTASQALGYLLAMQTKGIPVTLAYVADLHDSQVTGNGLGPGDPDYVAQIKSYDAGFDKFFKRLNDAGINETNTLFIITADEGDHFVGTAPTPANCDGVNIACQYDYTKVGELDLNINGLVAAQTGNTTPFDLHSDMAPTIYVDGNPDRTSPATRQLERDFAKLTALNPITNHVDHLAVALADPVEMGLLHMITADPARTPSFTMFGRQDYWFTNSGPITPVFDDPVNGNAWNHGGIQPAIANIWLGMVGPGIRKGSDSEDDEDRGESAVIEFSDHTDVRPTVLALLGLRDDYSHDGRVLLEALHPSALPDALRDVDKLVSLGRVYKQINAPFGELAQKTLKISTAALVSNAGGDAVYTKLENKLKAWRDWRDALARQMRDILEGAAFGGKEVSDERVEDLIEKANALLGQVRACSADTAACAK